MIWIILFLAVAIQCAVRLGVLVLLFHNYWFDVFSVLYAIFVGHAVSLFHSYRSAGGLHFLNEIFMQNYHNDRNEERGEQRRWWWWATDDHNGNAKQYEKMKWNEQLKLLILYFCIKIMKIYYFGRNGWTLKYHMGMTGGGFRMMFRRFNVVVAFGRFHHSALQ